MPMTHDEKLALGKVCGCGQGDCEYCQALWIERRAQEIMDVFNKIEPEEWAKKQRGYVWQKPKSG